jgi:hypothetical protein
MADEDDSAFSMLETRHKREFKTHSAHNMKLVLTAYYIERNTLESHMELRDQIIARGKASRDPSLFCDLV